MKKIALISDTHSHLGEDVVEHLKDVDEIWHAGDIGLVHVIHDLEKLGKELRGVYGNIDDTDVRVIFPLNNSFECEGVKVFITHIGGYPGRYTKRVKQLLVENKPDIYICGHSHICKVVRDKQLDLIHMNPGACGMVGNHNVRTILLFDCNNSKIENLRVVELGERSNLS